VAASNESSNFALPAVLVTILAALGLGAPLLRSPAAKPDANTHSGVHASSAAKPPYAHSAVEQILDFFDRDEGQFEPDKPWSRGAHPCGLEMRGGKPTSDCSDDLPPYHISFLIATVPDPDSVPLRYQFDTYLDAIEQAANTAGFNLYSFDLPWLKSGEEQSPSFRLGEPIEIDGPSDPSARIDAWEDKDRGNSHGLKLEMKSNDDKPAANWAPGVMLFHSRAQSSRKLLVVFLVAEKSTRGVNPTTLRNALDEIAWLSGWRSDDQKEYPRAPEWLISLTQPPVSLRDRTILLTSDTPELQSNQPTGRRAVYLLGPSYSTSMAQLDLTIKEWRASFPSSPETAPIFATAAPIIVTSQGAPAVRLEAPQIVAETGSAPAAADDQNLNPADGISLGSTRYGWQELWGHIFCDLQNGLATLNPPTSSSLCATAPRPPTRHDIALLVPDTAPPISASSSEVLFLPYPAHISDVRTAFGKMPAESASAQSPLARRDLPIADESSERDPDVVPAFSGRSAMYDDLSLSNLFSTIYREDLKYVGISASDVEDLVFLVRQLRIWSPDVMVFTSSADLRFLHSDVNEDLDGMLVFSSYPLFSLNQRWTQGTSQPLLQVDGISPLRFDRRLQFPSEQAEGVYNATLRLLSHSLIDSSLEQDMAEYRAPFSDTKTPSPVLWLSVVGRDAIWPVAFHYSKDISAKNNFRFSPQFRLSWIPYPHSFAILIFCLGILCFIPSFLFWFSPEDIDHRFSWFPSFTRRHLRKIIKWLLPLNPVWFHILRGPADGALAEDRDIHGARNVCVAILMVCLLLASVIGLGFALLPVLYSLKLGHWQILDDRTLDTVLLLVFIVVVIVFPTLIAATIKALNAVFDALGSVTAVAVAVGSIVWFLLSSLFASFGQEWAWGGALVVLSISPPLLVPLFTAVDNSQISSIPLQPVIGTQVPDSVWQRIKTAFATGLTQLLVVFVVLGFGLWFVFSIYEKPAPFALFDFVRASDLWNGVSVLHPLLFAGIAGLCMAVCSLRRLNLLQECRVRSPFLGFDRDPASFLGSYQDPWSSFIAVGKCEQQVADRLEGPFLQLPLAVPIGALIAFAGIYFIWFRQWRIPPIDGTAFAWFFYSLLSVVYALFYVALLRFVYIWCALRKFLKVLYWHPTRTGYEELRKKTVPDRPEAQHVTLFEPRPSFSSIEGSLGFARKLMQHFHRLTSVEGSIAAGQIDSFALLSERVDEAERELSSALQAEAENNPCRAIISRRAAQAAMTRLSAVVSSIFEPFWRAVPKRSFTPPGKEERELLEWGNLFVAARVVDFLRQVFPQMLNLAGFSTAGALAMTLAVSSYPFPARDTLLWFSWTILLSVAGIILLVFVQINRDRVLSMLTGTTPGKLNWNSSFVLQILGFAVIPALALLGAQFPHALGGMFSWIAGLFGGSK
jgi:hypothetical protein